MTWTGVRTWLGFHPQAVATAAGTLVVGWLSAFAALTSLEAPSTLCDHLLGWSFALAQLFCLALGCLVATLRLRAGLDTRPLVTSFLRWRMFGFVAVATLASATIVAIDGATFFMVPAVCVASVFCLMATHGSVMLGLAAAHVIRWIVVARGRWEIARPVIAANQMDTHSHGWPESAALTSVTAMAFLTIAADGALFAAIDLGDLGWQWGSELFVICTVSAMAWALLLCAWMTVVRRAVLLGIWQIALGLAMPLILSLPVMIALLVQDARAEETEGSGMPLAAVLVFVYAAGGLALAQSGLIGVGLGSAAYNLDCRVFAVQRTL